MKSNIIVFSFVIVALWACSGERTTETSQNQVLIKETPDFSADSAYSYIQKQVDFGPRVPETEGHKKTKEWLIQKLESFGMQVETQEFQAKTYDNQLWNLTNIVASHNPSASRRILLGAHWDTRRIADKDTQNIDIPFDGANDGGSGVAVLLEIARILGSSAIQPEVGVDIILFDGEDDGEPEGTRTRNNAQTWWCLGSQHWSKTPHRAGYSAYYGILVDMVGAKGARFYREGHSMQYAKNIVNKVWNFAAELGYSDFFVMRDAPEIIDDHLFVNKIAGIPMINIVEFSPDYGFGHYHHTHADNMDMIDPRPLKAVGQTVLFTLYQE